MQSISVVICNYNYGTFIEDAIESVLQQEVPPCEIILIDDGSTDDSRDRVRRFADRIEIVFKENEGQCSAYNIGIERVKGDFVLILDSDDLLLPGAISQIQRHLSEDISKIQFRLRLIDKYGKEQGQPIPRAVKSFDALRLTRAGIEYPSPPASGNVYRTDFVKRLLPLPVDKIDKFGADFFLIFASPYFGKIINISETLGAYRVHQSSSDFIFGNSKATHAFKDRRIESWRNWLQPHLQEPLPKQFTSFASRKSHYASSCLSSGLRKRLKLLFREAPELISLVMATPQYSVFEKIALFLWICFLPLLPSSILRRLSRSVCNPIAR